MDEKIVIAVLAGTVRTGRRSINAAQYVAGQGKQLPNVEIIFVDPKELHLPNDGNLPEDRDPRYSEITAKADAFFIVMPEYNHSYPATLKRMLDSEFDNYRRKPVALAGVSDGPWGGARGIENLLPCLRTLSLLPISQTVYFPFVQNIFDDHGNILPEHEEKYQKSIAGSYKELAWLARTLKWGRNNIAS